MISDDYHDIGQLLLLTIIVKSKNLTISIIVKGNMTVNRQKRLIVHPYTLLRTTILTSFVICTILLAVG